MSEPTPTTLTLAISDIKTRLSRIVNEVYRKEARILVEKAGIPVAALVSIEDLKRLERLDEEDREAWDVLEAMRAPFRGVSSEEIEREAARAIAEVRAERRAARAAVAKSA